MSSLGGPGPPSTGSPWKRAAIVLAGLLCLGLGLRALLSGRPPSKRVDGVLTCEELLVPAAAGWDLNAGRTQLRAARLWGFEGSIANVGQAGSLKKSPARRLDFEPAAGGPAPFLELVPGGAFGAMSLDAGAGAVLKPADMRDGGVCAQLLVPSGVRAVLRLNSDALRVRATRYLPLPAGIAGDAPLAGIGPAEPLYAELRSAPAAGVSHQAQLCFQDAGQEIALVEPGKSPPIDAGDSLKFGGVLNPSIKIEGYRNLSAVAADRRTDLVIAGSGLRLTGLFLAPGAQGRSALRVTASGQARSIRQGGREILPTWLEDVAEGWWTKSGLWLALAGLVLVAARKLIDRSLDLLIKKFLPG